MAASGGPTYLYELPSLGADMDEGRIVEWKVAIGDVVHRGDVLASVETEKSDIDIEIWSDGVVDAFLVDLDEWVPVGTPVLRLRSADGSTTPTPTPTTTTTTIITDPARPAAQSFSGQIGAESVLIRPENVRPSAVAGPLPSGIRASPLARRIAAERGIDLITVEGSGPNGAIVAADVEPIVDVEPQRAVDPMRRLIAERMSTANREIPHYYLERQVDLSALTRWLETRNLDRPIAERVLPAAAYVRAVGIAASRHRELNGWWTDGAFQQGLTVDVAMAISLRRGGLVTPKIASADERSIDEIMSTLRELVAASRTGSLRASWMTGATITITNLGEHGADLVHGVISPPQVALVGFGRVDDRPWAVDGDVVVRPIVTVTLAADHRATDGAAGSRLLNAIAELLEHPEDL